MDRHAQQLCLQSATNWNFQRQKRMRTNSLNIQCLRRPRLRLFLENIGKQSQQQPKFVLIISVALCSAEKLLMPWMWRNCLWHARPSSFYKLPVVDWSWWCIKLRVEDVTSVNKCKLDRMTPNYSGFISIYFTVLLLGSGSLSTLGSFTSFLRMFVMAK